MGLVVELAVGRLVAGGGGPEVVAAVGVDRLLGLLGVEAGAGQVAVEETGASLLPRMVATVGPPTHTSRRLWVDAQTMARAATSGW